MRASAHAGSVIWGNNAGSEYLEAFDSATGLLIPGQQFSLDVTWNLRSDDGIYLPSEMDFTRLRQRYCDPNVRCANPENFVVEVSLNVYDRLGYISAPAKVFVFVGRTCDAPGYPPCN